MDKSAKPMFADEIAKWIKFKNEDRGPYGLKLTVIRMKKRMGKAPLVSFDVHVVDRNGELMWPALTQSMEMEMAEGNTFTFSDLAEAFKFSYSTAPTR